jgi:RIO kinase 1
VHAQETLSEAIEPFLIEGLIAEVLYPIKSGKEATVYCCRASTALSSANGRAPGVELVAAKVYKPRSFRSFRNDAMYREGRVILNARDRRAAAKMSEHGQEVRAGMWTGHEYATLRSLYAVGANVPRPIAQSQAAILMEFIGDANGPAPVLRSVSVPFDEAEPALERLLWNIELWLSCDVVHGDLSPYNVLWFDGEPTVIDFPQAVDPRFNGNAFSLLLRDVTNVCTYFERQGVMRDAFGIAERMWDNWVRPG